ncbi:NAD(P)H-dependent oxidoreductase [Streptomyces sp. NPDC005790]|uniref:NADPH-dependent FMN reductase n=1 Tax=Streptomyces sp. NPDC005790 TaxID=3154777 RepID=UPI0033DC62B4
MSKDTLHLAVIVSSVREGRFGPVVGRWFAGRAKGREDFTVDVVDLADHMLPAVHSHTPSPDALSVLSEVSPRLEAADAYVVVTPEYNHSYPAALKQLIDWHYTQWRAKPVGFVSYGGVSGGLRAVEHLRQVFAELHAVSVRDGVSFHSAWERFDEGGEPKDPAGPEGAAEVMLDQLGWWASTLRRGRAVAPYRA